MFDPTAVTWLASTWAGDPTWAPPASGTQAVDMPGDGALIPGVGGPVWWQSGAEMGGVPIFSTGVSKAAKVNIGVPATSGITSIVFVGRLASLDSSRNLWGKGIASLSYFRFGSDTWRLKAGKTLATAVLADDLPHVFTAVIDSAGTDSLAIDGMEVASGNAGSNVPVGDIHIGASGNLNDWTSEDFNFFGAYDGDIRNDASYPQMLADAVADIGGQGASTPEHPLQQSVDDLPDGTVDPDGHINWSTLDLSDTPFPYDSDVTLFVEDKQYVRIVGRGGGVKATDRGLRLRTISDGAGTQPGDRDGTSLNWPRTRAHMIVRNSHNVWIDGITIEGTWKTLGATVWDLEAQAAIRIGGGSTHVLVENCWLQGCYGDGVELQNCSDCVIRWNYITQTGRHGIGNVNSKRCEAYGNRFSVIGRFPLDIESTGSGTAVYDFKFEHNDLEIHANGLLLAQNQAHHSWLRYNRSKLHAIRVQGNAAGPIYFEHNVSEGIGQDVGAGRTGVAFSIKGNMVRTRRDGEAWQRYANGALADVASNSSNSFVEENP